MERNGGKPSTTAGWKDGAWVLSSKEINFPYPVALTLLHMVFSSVVCFAITKVFKIIKIEEGMTTDIYISSVIPIGAMFAMTLWLGNSAYLYISVAFAQMLKAIMPVAVFLLGAAFGLEEMSYKMLAIMSVISVGVIVASVGEITISWVGVVYQMGGVVAEALRLIFIEIFLKKKGVKLNLISMMYYVSPCSAVCLFIPWLFLEKPKMDDSISWNFPPFTLFLNCLCTFVLNMSVFLVISRTSALTARVTGVVRDWSVVLLSAAIFADTKLTFINIVGYAIAIAGVVAYNNHKLKVKPQVNQQQGEENKINPGSPQDEKLAIDFAELVSSPWTKYILFILQIDREDICTMMFKKCSERWSPESLFVLGFLGCLGNEDIAICEVHLRPLKFSAKRNEQGLCIILQNACEFTVITQSPGPIGFIWFGLSLVEPGHLRPHLAQPLPSRAAAARCGPAERAGPGRRQRGQQSQRPPRAAILRRQALGISAPLILKFFVGQTDPRRMEEADSSESSASDQQQKASLPLPAAFLEFLSENGLDPAVYSMASTIPRYIRLKPGMESQVAEIESELNCCLEKVSWLPGFYAIPPEVQIAGSKAYQEGKIYGIDAASGAAILALDVQPGDHVLDLCAAPDMLGSTGSLTGVDVAKHRLAACRTMLQKYSLGDRTRLFVADGTLFSLLPVNSALRRTEESIGLEENGSTFSEWTSRRSWKDRQKTKKANATGSRHLQSNSEPELIYYGKNSGLVGLRKCDVLCSSAGDEACTSGYDKVLVDAECTHDGSIKHIQKFEFWGWKTLDRRVLDAERTDNLFHLQIYKRLMQLIIGLAEVVAYPKPFALIPQLRKLVVFLLPSSLNCRLKAFSDLSSCGMPCPTDAPFTCNTCFPCQQLEW
ncbi:hypothetical protein EJB05_09954, partial [Eragrostis curvula]